MVTPETLTMRQIAAVKEWAIANGSKRLLRTPSDASGTTRTPTRRCAGFAST